MLHMVLDDTKLQELYDYDQSEYEDLYTALNSDNVVVASVARIIKGASMVLLMRVFKRKCIKQYFLILIKLIDMIIKKIEIENFRSYYKSNVFELVNSLNLIIGSNGDGKTHVL